MRGPEFSKHVGTQHPPLLVEIVEDQLVVTWVRAPEPDTPEPGAPEPGATPALSVGGVILAVDGETIADKRARLAPYLAASTPQALRSRLSTMLLAGAQDSSAQLAVRGAGTGQRAVAVIRDSMARQLFRQRGEARGEIHRLLPEGFGYADLTRLEPPAVKDVFEAFREAPAIVFDMRGYPRGTAWAITPWLAAEQAVAAQFRRPTYLGVEAEADLTNAGVEYRFDQLFPAGGTPWQYDGAIVVLIDEKAVSQSEHTCLFFASAYDDVTFVGSPTNGANGDVTGLPLPGGIWVNFSGHDVRHADGAQLQRAGIQPDVQAAPTIAGVRAGRDEVLEAAIAHLRARELR